MKWGVRRYQNEDGSLTPAGLKRYADDTQKATTVMSNLKSAKSRYDAARKEYNKAYNKYCYFSTPSNIRAYEKATADLQTAHKAYKKAKLDHRVLDKQTDGTLNRQHKSKHRTMLEEKYRKMGYSKDQAAVMADDKIKAERVLTAAAAMTVTACSVYAYRKHLKNKTDGLIKAGDYLQRIEMQNTDGKLHDVFFVSKGEHDNKRYKGMLGMTRKQQTGHAYLMQLEANKDIKVASRNKAVETFSDLYKNDFEFRKTVEKHVSSHWNGENKVDVNKLSSKNLNKMYDNFNSALIDIRRDGTGADKKFYNALKSAGYGAIQDVNDMKFSGYNAKNPLIVFDNSNKNIMVKSMTEMTNSSDLVKSGMAELKKASYEQLRESFISSTLSPTTAAVVTGVAASTYATDHVDASKNIKIRR